MKSSLCGTSNNESRTRVVLRLDFMFKARQAAKTWGGEIHSFIDGTVSLEGLHDNFIDSAKVDGISEMKPLRSSEETTNWLEARRACHRLL